MTPNGRRGAATAPLLNRKATTPADVQIVHSTADNTMNIATMSPALWAFGMEFYALGYGHGRDDGYTTGHKDAEDEMDAAWAPVAQRIHRTAAEPSHEQLVERRRSHQVAAAGRARQSPADWPESAA